MRIHYGKQIAGPLLIIPQVILFGGCVFICAWRRSVMVSIPDWLIKEAAIWGINLVGE